MLYMLSNVVIMWWNRGLGFSNDVVKLMWRDRTQSSSENESCLKEGASCHQEGVRIRATRTNKRVSANTRYTWERRTVHVSVCWQKCNGWVVQGFGKSTFPTIHLPPHVIIQYPSDPQSSEWLTNQIYRSVNKDSPIAPILSNCNFSEPQIPRERHGESERSPRRIIRNPATFLYLPIQIGRSVTIRTPFKSGLSALGIQNRQFVNSNVAIMGVPIQIISLIDFQPGLAVKEEWRGKKSAFRASL